MPKSRLRSVVGWDMTLTSTLAVLDWSNGAGRFYRCV